MGELSQKGATDNVNVMLQRRQAELSPLIGKQFPCPLCGVGLDIRLSRTQKPYCVCQGCGNQVFFRGKEGIRRLREILHSGSLITATGSKADFAVILFNRVQQLKEQKRQLQVKQGLIFVDSDLENVISAVDKEIERMQGELEKLAQK